ncbi:MAG: LamG domain-containing protein [Bdellovibrionales bacterium]|nr:LamG domain-containing protein [Bdellovibrionales bacterium]
MKKHNLFIQSLRLCLVITFGFLVACKESPTDPDNSGGTGGGGGGTGNGSINGGSLAFDGSGKYLTTSRAWYTGDFTICLWMKPASVAGQTLLSMSSGDKYFYLSFDDNEIDWKFEDSADTDMTIDGSASFIVGNTYQVCAVGDHGGTGSRIYVNGAVVGTSGTMMGASAASAFTTLTIGAEPAPAFQSADGNKTLPFDGNLGHIMIWQTALPANAISQLYGGGSGFDPQFAFGNYTAPHVSALEVYYLYGDANSGDIITGSGAVIKDAMGNQDATPVGFDADDFDVNLF